MYAQPTERRFETISERERPETEIAEASHRTPVASSIPADARSVCLDPDVRSTE
jgi:hypothetical protein